MKPIIEVKNLKKKYRLGVIGTGSLAQDLKSYWARLRKKEDPNTMIGQETRKVGDSFMALNGVSFTVNKGETIGVIGSNGAGKSTLLKLITRVTGPTEGEIILRGRIASMLEVGTGFNGEMTGRENIYMNGAILGMTKAEIDSKLDDIIAFSECADFIDTPVKRYSSGMYVKLAFSVAAHLDSEIMIMDEVLAVGDMKFQKKCLSRMSEAAGNEGRTVLYVSHNMNTIRQLCTRCVVLDKGRIIFDGDVEEAIAVYMESNAELMGTDLDLSNSRMGHLPPKIPAKLERITLVDKTEPVYEFNENICFKLKINARTNVTHPCLRLEVRNSDDTPIGASYLHDLPGMEAGQDYTYQLLFRNHRLVQGKYKVLLVLYEVNEFGTYNDLDAVWPAFTFEITDSVNQIKLNWDNYSWGRINYQEMEMRLL